MDYERFMENLIADPFSAPPSAGDIIRCYNNIVRAYNNPLSKSSQSQKFTIAKVKDVMQVYISSDKALFSNKSLPVLRFLCFRKEDRDLRLTILDTKGPNKGDIIKSYAVKGQV